MRTTQTLFALGLATLSCMAVAQPAPVGTVQSVGGLVTVSDASTVNNAVPGMTFANGAQFVTSSNGTAVLRVGRDCEIRLKPNQSFTVDKDKTCDGLLALVQNLPGAAVVATSGPALPLLGVALAGAVLAGNSGRGTAAVVGGGGQTPDPGGGGGVPTPPISPQ